VGRTGGGPSCRWALAGVSSYAVNRAVKSVVDRQRPEEHLEASVRTPSSSSFPSGHTLAAFCTAFVLSESPTGTATAGRIRQRRGRQPGAPAGPSPSDVLGGARSARLSDWPCAQWSTVSPGVPSPAEALGPGNGTGGLHVEEVMKPFFRHLGLPLPFARNIHEHLVAGLADGADWDVSFLSVHAQPGPRARRGNPVWDDPRNSMT